MIPLNSGNLACLPACVILFLQYTHAHGYIRMYCMYVVRPGWSPAGGMIPACIRPLWDSMW